MKFIIQYNLIQEEQLQKIKKAVEKRDCNSAVECLVANENVVGSIPTSRSNFRLHSLMVRTPGFQSVNRSSILLGATNLGDNT